jgi:hypothetical protein
MCWYKITQKLLFVEEEHCIIYDDIDDKTRYLINDVLLAITRVQHLFACQICKE